MRWTEEQLRDYEQRRARQNTVGGVASSAQSERSSAMEPVGSIPPTHDGQMRRLVRFTVCRQRLLDDDNIYVKDMLDALKEAGAIVDDSTKFCKVEIIQRQASGPEYECTIIEIEPLA